jgi:hypothetical protein
MPLAEKTVLPAGASTTTAAGPNFTAPQPHPDQVPTLRPDANELMANAPPGRCIRRGCSGQLGVRRGIIRIPTGAGLYANEDSERCRRQSYVACQLCGTVVPVSHPLQQKLDADWRAVEEKEKAERERQQKAAAAAGPAKPVQPINPVVGLPEQTNANTDDIARLRRDHQALQQRVAALERKASDGTPF